MSSEILNMLYNWPTWVIVAGLFAGMVTANEIGFRVGRRGHDQETDLSRSVSNALKGSIFALVALLLGFSFSSTTNRYEIRQRLVLDQANAVGTCYLRAGLLDDSAQQSIQSTLRNYVDARLEQCRVGHDASRFAQIQTGIDRRLQDLWDGVQTANRRNPDLVRNSLIVPAANDVIDLSSTRAWANRNHLPDPVLALLLGSVVITSLLLGHSSGQSGRRHLGLWMASNVVFSLVLFVVLDFDRPRRGLIRVDQTPLEQLRDSIALPPGAEVKPTSKP